MNPERLGLAGNWNRCIEGARTPLVAVFHQDDVMHPGFLARHRRAFAAPERPGMVASAALVIDSDGRDVPETIVGRGGLGPADRMYAAGEVVRDLATSNPFRCSGVSLRKDAALSAGLFDFTFRYVVDWDFWLRMGRSWPVAWLAEPSVSIRWHPASETHRFRGGTADLDETTRLLDRIFSQEAADWPDRRVLRKKADRRLARAYLNRAHDAARGHDPALVRLCLGRALGLSPGIAGRIASDPRLAARLAWGLVAPNRLDRSGGGP